MRHFRPRPPDSVMTAEVVGLGLVETWPGKDDGDQVWEITFRTEDPVRRVQLVTAGGGRELAVVVVETQP